MAVDTIEPNHTVRGAGKLQETINAVRRTGVEAAELEAKLEGRPKKSVELEGGKNDK